MALHGVAQDNLEQCGWDHHSYSKCLEMAWLSVVEVDALDKVAEVVYKAQFADSYHSGDRHKDRDFGVVHNVVDDIADRTLDNCAGDKLPVVCNHLGFGMAVNNHLDKIDHLDCCNSAKILTW